MNHAKLLCSSGAFSRYPDHIDHTAIEEFGPQLTVDGIEVMFYPQWYTQIDTIAAGLRRTGQYFPVMHSDKNIGIIFGKADPAERLQGITRLEENCRLGSEIGVEVMVLHLWGWPELDDNLVYNLEHLQRCLDITDRYHMQLALETIPCRQHDPLYNVEQAINCDSRSQVALDTEFLAMHDKVTEVFAQHHLWEEQRIRHIHIKDYSGNGLTENGKRRYLHPGEGCVDFTAFFAGLQEKNFDGFISLEAPALDQQGNIDVAKLQASLHFIRQQLSLTQHV